MTPHAATMLKGRAEAGAMSRRRWPAALAPVLVALAFCGRAGGAVNLCEESSAGPVFPLVAGGTAAPIVLPAGAPAVVKIAARDLAGDIEAVSGIAPKVVDAASVAGDSARVEVVFAPELAGRWEAFRLSATPRVLTIAGSDRRGLAYGIYELSRRIGVSPWRWWADVAVRRRAELRLSVGSEPIEQPAVRYRGVFINDEDWGLHPWAAKTFEPEVGDIGPKTYAKLCELLLRLRANCLWPAMHECTRAFNSIPQNKQVADDYAIVMGSSHAEPMLFNNATEWTLPSEQWNYETHPEAVRAVWEKRLQENGRYENIYTLGIRGIHDRPMQGGRTTAERVKLLERVFADQRQLIARYVNPKVEAVPQIFVPYKEVLELYNAGLRVPEDVTIVWPDDNFGYIRRFGAAAERERAGGLGVYYHASYLGAPLSWLWIDTLPPALVWSEMMRAWQHGSRSVWIVNVGDIKNTERSMEFFLHLAWHADRTDPDAADRFVRQSAARDFGPAHAAAIADILRRLHAINFARKTEHLQWHLSLKPYRPTELNETEIHQRLRACAELLRDSDTLAERLPAEARDAYFELVGYPVAITAAANERYFRSELARADAARGRSPETNLAAAARAETRIAELTARYNHDIAGGKWRHIVTANGLSPNVWKRFQPDRSAPRPDPAPDNVCPPAPPEAGPLPRPRGARSGDFVEHAGAVSIHAGHFTGRTDSASGAGWRVIAGLGRTGCAVTVLPSNAVIRPDAAPSVQYRFHLATGGPVTVRVRLLPTYPLTPGDGLRLAVAVDDARPLPLAVTDGFSPETELWSRRVLANAVEATAPLAQPLRRGWHTLRLIAVDAGVVVDKIVLDLGGLRPSYDGPPETRVP